jgi:hypothetical protein
VKPRRPARHPEIEFREWQIYLVDAMSGAGNNATCEGMSSSNY